MNNIKFFLLLIGCSLLIIQCGPADHISVTGKHVVEYYFPQGYEKNSSNSSIINNNSIQFENDLKIINNLCEKLGLQHEFVYGGMHGTNRTTYQENNNRFLENRTDNPEVFKIFLEPKMGLDREPKFVNEARYISLPYNERHNISIVLHELVHRILIHEKHDLHVPTEYQGGVCSNENYFCLNLMSKDYYVPFNFLITEGQRKIINTGYYDTSQPPLSPCNVLIPEELAHLDLLNEIACYPRIEKIDPDYLKYRTKIDLYALLDHEKKQLNWTLNKLISVDKNIDGNKVFVQQENVSKEYDTLALVRTINLAADLIKFYYLESKHFNKLLQAEADFLTNNGKIIDTASYIQTKKNSMLNRMSQGNEKVIPTAERMRIKSMIMDNVEELKNIFGLEQMATVLPGSWVIHKNNNVSLDLVLPDGDVGKFLLNSKLAKNFKVKIEGDVLVQFDKNSRIKSLRPYPQDGERRQVNKPIEKGETK